MSGAGAAAAGPQPSERAVVAIIGWEVGDGDTYVRTCARPTWPGGDSGITIGIGYDLGYADNSAFRADWMASLPIQVVDRLAQLCGRTGARASAQLWMVQDIVVPWPAAEEVFRERTLPQETARTLAAFPGAETLSPDSLGALVSLVYNRGTSLDGPRRAEMRDIRDALAEGRAGDVPQLIRSMKRLWPNVPGLRDRRDEEALLFEAGLPHSLMDIG